MDSRNGGITEVLGEILLVILVIALVVIIAAMVFGLIDIFPKSAYVAVGMNVTNNSGNYYLAVSHRAGDIVYLNGSPVHEGMPVDFQIRPPQGGLFLAHPDGPVVWRPGDTVYVYYQSGDYRVTNLSAVAASGAGLSAGEWGFDIVDSRVHVIVYTTRIGIGDFVTNTTAATTVPTATTMVTTSAATTTATTTPSGCGCFSVVDFTAANIGNLNVKFEDISVPQPDSCLWNFGDGGSSTKCKETYKYAAAGTYTVSLSITSSCGSCSVSRPVAVS